MAANNTQKVTNNETVEKNKISAKDIDMTQYVTVRNGFQGRLFYKSPRTGERFVWESFGDEQEMELRELKNAKNSSKKFFVNNWFMFDEDWIVDFLGVKKYYSNAVSVEDFDKIFFKSVSEIKKIISDMSPGQKRSAAYRARQLINSGDIDSKKSITAIESALGIQLVES